MRTVGPVLRSALGVAGLALVVAAGCARQPAESSNLQDADLQVPEGVTFTADTLMTDAAFADAEALGVEKLQEFFRKTPYGRASFLETYQSNGLRAAAAVARAAVRYRVSPLLLLAELQAVQGLVGATVYPQPPAKVEYAFECGCGAPDRCDPAYAGLDRQLECFASSLREAFDAAKKGGTPAGWAPGKTMRTLDGASVTPSNAATAALYDRTPTLGEKKTGAWLRWALFNRYATHVAYFPPFEQPVGTAWVGDACTQDSDCGYEGGFCDLAPPGGLCTAACDAATPCPTREGFVGNFCAAFGAGSFCFNLCVADQPNACRIGFSCVSKPRVGAGDPAQDTVCAPS